MAWDCFLGPKVIDQVLNIRFSWVIATQEKKESKVIQPKTP